MSSTTTDTVKPLEFPLPKPIQKKHLPKLLKFTTFEEDEILKLSRTEVNTNLTKIFIEYSNADKVITLDEFRQIFNHRENADLLYLVAINYGTGKSNPYLDLNDWLKFSSSLLFLNNNFDLKYKQLRVASIKSTELENDDEFKFVFKLFKIMEHVLINEKINVDENFIAFEDFCYIVKMFNAESYKKIISYLDVKPKVLEYSKFISLIHDIPIIHFQYEFNKNYHTNIPITDFKKILHQQVFKNQIPLEILNKIDDLLPYFSNTQDLNYKQCITIIKFLQNLPKFNYLLINNIYQTGTSSNNLISIDEFYRYVNDYNNLIPNLQSLTELDEIDLYFYWNSVILNEHLKNSTTTNDSINKLEVLTLLSDFDIRSTNKILEKNGVSGSLAKDQLAESTLSFLLGSIAGAFGATMVYPIDLVKTRMQLQRNVKLYSGYLDCFLKVFKLEGARGFYRGIIPQWVGVAPEKLIKLTVNDLVRKMGSNDDGSVPFPWEVLAGCCAGAAQVVFTNPLEIVKIRLQVLGESQLQISAFQIINKLGLKGLYKGASACLMRDVPFSAIYFPTYANLKKYLFNYDPTDASKVQHLSSVQLLMSGALAGIPALYFTTPFDVLKTRLQVETKQHETKYLNMRHCANTIFKEEGLRAFFKGGLARVCRSSPQFGFTLLSYEFLQKHLSYDALFNKNKPVVFGQDSDMSSTAINVINPSKISKETGNTEFTKLNKFNFYGIGNNANLHRQSQDIINGDIKDYTYGLETLLQFRILKNFDKISKICNEFQFKFDKVDYLKMLQN